MAALAPYQVPTTDLDLGRYYAKSYLFSDEELKSCGLYSWLCGATKVRYLEMYYVLDADKWRSEPQGPILTLFPRGTQITNVPAGSGPFKVLSLEHLRELLAGYVQPICLT